MDANLGYIVSKTNMDYTQGPGVPSRCLYPTTQSCHRVQGLLTWGSGLGVHSMARGEAAAHLRSVDEQKERPRASKLLPYLAALGHPAVAGVQHGVGTAVWRLRRRRYSQATAGDWRAHPLGLGRWWVPALHRSPSPPGWT